MSRYHIALALVAAATMVGDASAQTWVNPAGGDWFEPSNWNPATVPNSTTASAVIGAPGTYTVSLAGVIDVASLTSQNAQATLALRPGARLWPRTTLNLAGPLVVNSERASPTSSVWLAGGATLGAPVVRLNSPPGPSSFAILRQSGGTGGAIVSGLVTGAGAFEGNWTIRGEVRADVPGDAIRFLSSTPRTNAGLIRAVDGGVVEFFSGSVVTNTGGVIAAEGAGSIVRTRAQIDGGVVRGTGGGVVEVPSGGAWNQVRAHGKVHVLGGGFLTVNNLDPSSDAEFFVNSTGAAQSTSLTVGNSLSLPGGVVRLNATDGVGSRAQLTGSVNAQLTIGPAATVRGAGLVQSAWLNRGLVVADAPGRTLQLATTPQSSRNESVMRAENGATLLFDRFNMTQSPGARLIADGPESAVTLNGVQLTGGSIETLGGARLEVQGQSRFTDVRLPRRVVMAPGARLQLPIELLEPVEDFSVAPGGVLTFNTSGVLPGRGVLRLPGPNAVGGVATVSVPASGTITVPLGREVRGGAWLSGAWVNEGVMWADPLSPALRLTGSTTPHINRGLMGAGKFTSIEFGTSVVTQSTKGAIVADGVNATVAFEPGTFSRVEINGGRVAAVNGGQILVKGRVQLTDVQLEGPVYFSSLPNSSISAAFIVQGSPLVHDDRMELDNGSGITVATGSALEGRGTARFTSPLPLLRSSIFNAGLSTSGTTGVATIGRDRVTEGSGEMTGDWLHRGTFLVGTDATIGTWSVRGNITLAASSRLRMKVSSPSFGGQFDQFISRGLGELNWTLGGSLEMRLLDTATFAIGSEFPIITGAQRIQGRFATLENPVIDAKREWRVRYTTTEVRAVIACRVDFNDDLQATFDDVSAFVAWYLVNDPRADFTRDGEVTLDDLQVFLVAYNAGC